jgi:molecular chaperone DnaK (HSP70)
MKIGIDLGSSTTLTAFIGVEGAPILIPDAADQRRQATPSRVLLQGDRALIGHFAERLGRESASATIVSNFKRHFGTNQALASFNGQPVYSEAVAALLLKKIRNDAEIYTGEAVDSCVITVPAHFHEQQRRSLVSAAEIADIDLIALLDEPIAAALNYTENHPLNDDEIIVIYDIGGGTFDLSVLTCANQQVHILAKSGLTNLGGFEFDQILQQRFRDDFAAAFGTKIKKNDVNDHRVSRVAEEIKYKLNGGGAAWPTTDVYVDGKFLHWTMDPQEYRQKADILLKKTEASLLKTLRGIGLELSDISRFVLIGGASRAAVVQDFWRQRLDTEKHALVDDQPLESVAKGAALYAHSFAKSQDGGGFISNMRMSSVTAYNIGIKEKQTGHFERLIDKNAALPASGAAIIGVHLGGNTGFSAQIFQYLDDADAMDPIGSVVVQPHHLAGKSSLELTIKNNADGTLGVKVIDPQNRKVIPFMFEDSAAEGRDVLSQKKIVSAYRINAQEA